MQSYYDESKMSWIVLTFNFINKLNNTIFWKQKNTLQNHWRRIRWMLYCFYDEKLNNRFNNKSRVLIASSWYELPRIEKRDELINLKILIKFIWYEEAFKHLQYLCIHFHVLLS